MFLPYQRWPITFFMFEAARGACIERGAFSWVDCTVSEMGDDDRFVHMTAGAFTSLAQRGEPPDTGFG
jgi:hypothetical protein